MIFDDDPTGTDGGNVYVIDVPQIKYTEGGLPNQGLDQDIPVNLSFQAVLHPTLNRQLRIWRIPT
jgi:hypothetical protein